MHRHVVGRARLALQSLPHGQGYDETTAADALPAADHLMAAGRLGATAWAREQVAVLVNATVAADRPPIQRAIACWLRSRSEP
jgi:hypothetical protein